MEQYVTVKEVFRALGAEKAVLWLKENLGIDAKPFEDGNLFMCNYSQIDSPKTHPLVIQCRSLIVDRNGDTISKKFDRFFNLGEAPEITGQVDFTDCEIFDKVDGSLIGIWFNPYSLEWDISTRSMPKAEGEFELPNGEEKTFREMVLNTLGVNEEQFQDKMNEIGQPYETYVFEWCSPLNRIVTPYETDRMYLLSYVHQDTECNPVTDGPEYEEVMKSIESDFQERFNNVERVSRYDVSSKTSDEVEALVSSLDGLKEGFVIRDRKTGIRVKVKSKTYVTAHRLRGEFKIPRNKDLCAIIRENEQDEFLTYFPEWSERVTDIKNSIGFYVNEIENTWNLLSPQYEDMKDFALQVQGCSVISNLGKSCLYTMKRKGSSVQDFVNGLTESKFHVFYLESLVCKIKSDEWFD